MSSYARPGLRPTTTASTSAPVSPRSVSVTVSRPLPVSRDSLPAGTSLIEPGEIHRTPAAPTTRPTTRTAAYTTNVRLDGRRSPRRESGLVSVGRRVDSARVDSARVGVAGAGADRANPGPRAA